jgi:flagellar biosynthesis protein FliR
LDLSLLNVNSILAFLLIVCRLSGMIVAAPLLGMRNIPAQTKIGLALAIALILFPLHAAHDVPHSKDLFQFGVIVFQEVAIGLLLGFIANLTFMALQMSGEFMSTQMGLSVAHVLDPVTQSQSPLIGQFFFYFAAMLFLSLNVHHALIAGVDRSLTWIPIGHFIGEGHLTAGVMVQRCIHLGSELFMLALTAGIPITGLLLVMEITLAFVAKVMPQMNVFMVAMPLKVLFGLLIILMALPAFGHVLGDQYAHLIQVLLNLYKT